MIDEGGECPSPEKSDGLVRAKARGKVQQIELGMGIRQSELTPRLHSCNILRKARLIQFPRSRDVQDCRTMYGSGACGVISFIANIIDYILGEL